MLTTHEPDDCCAKALSKALRSGELDDKDTWTHEKCGLEWKAEVYPALEGQQIKHWRPVPAIAVVRVR